MSNLITVLQNLNTFVETHALTKKTFLKYFKSSGLNNQCILNHKLNDVSFISINEIVSLNSNFCHEHERYCVTNPNILNLF